MDGWMDGWMDGCMDVHTDVHNNIYRIETLYALSIFDCQGIIITSIVRRQHSPPNWNLTLTAKSVKDIIKVS